MNYYNIYQSGKRLYIDEKENPDNKIVVNKYDNMQQTLRLISDGTLPPRLYWALRNPKLSNKYFILKLVNNEDLIVGTDISATPGLWDMLLIGTDDDYIIEGTDIDQSKLTYVSDHFGRLFVRDNFLEELDFEEQTSPTFRVFYDEIIFQLGNKADTKDIPDKLSDLENDTNFISGVALKDDGEGNVKIIGTTFGGGETEDGEIPSGGNIEVDDKLDEESTNPVQNQVVTKEIKTLKDKDESLDKEILTLREENEALEQKNAELESSIEKLQIKQTTDKAPFHHITDSANMKVLDFGMEGKTEQDSTEGNQLFDSYDSANTYGIEAKITKGVLHYTGTAAANSSYVWCFGNHTNTTEIMRLDAGTYTLGSNLMIRTYDGADITNHKGTFTLEESRPVVAMRYYTTITDGTTYDNYVNIMLNPGSTLLEWEPYTNGPSPNPDFPQEIKNAGVYNEATGRYEHRFGFVNENLLPNNPEKWDIGKMLYWGASKGTEVGWATRVYSAYTEIEIQPNTNICFHNDMTNKYWVSRIVETDSNRFGYSNHDLYTSIAKNYADYSFKTLSNTVKLLVEVRLVDDTQTFTEADLQEMKIAFGYGDSVIYTPHQSQPFTLTSPEPLTKWDKLVKRDGVYGWSVNSMNRQLIGTYSNNTITNGWNTFVSDTIPEGIYVYALDMLDKLLGVDNILCTTYYNNGKAAYNKNAALNKQSGISSGTRIFFGTNFSTAEEWKAYLDENPLDIWYQTASEVAFHPLPEEEQILLNNLETYYGVTNLYNDQGCPMWLSYTCDSKLYVDQKLEQINNALLSLGANV